MMKIKFKIGMLAILLCCAMFGGEPETEVIKGNNGEESQVRLIPGQRIQLMLSSNPTTGYDWEFFLLLSGCVTVEKNEFCPPDRMLCGAGGVRVVTVKAVRKGEGKLLGFYRRPWEPFDPAKSPHYLLKISVVDK